MDEKELVVKSENKNDLLSKTKTIYEAGAGEIFWKNFLAGFSRGLGNLFIYILFLVITSVILYNLVLPKILPLITSYTNLLKSFESVSSPGNKQFPNLLGQ